MLLQLLNDKDIKFCLANWDVNEDGAKSQPLSEEYKIKQNTESSSISNEVRDFIFQKIYGNHYINSVVGPSKVSVNYCNEYQEGDYYLKHVDAFKATPKSANVFFDYGFSIILDDEYKGGEFVLENDVGEISYDVKKGQMLIFPIIYPHSVSEVTSGSRKAIIGWMSSNISYERSHILKQLYHICTNAIASKNSDMIVKSSIVQNYLLKEWSK